MKKFYRGFTSTNKTYLILGLLLITAIIGGFVLLGKNNTERFTNDSPASLKYFFMSACPHCVQFNSVWDELVNKSTKDPALKKVTFEKFDLNAEGSKMGDQYGVNGAPTVILTKDNKKVEFEGKREVKSLMDFIKQNL